jgi:hypothetical protein
MVVILTVSNFSEFFSLIILTKDNRIGNHEEIFQDKNAYANH